MLWHISEKLSRGVLCCDDRKQWTMLYREQGLESEQGSDSKPTYKTNDREIEAQLICLLFVCVCVQTVCDKAVS